MVGWLCQLITANASPVRRWTVVDVELVVIVKYGAVLLPYTLQLSILLLDILNVNIIADGMSSMDGRTPNVGGTLPTDDQPLDSRDSGEPQADANGLVYMAENERR